MEQVTLCAHRGAVRLHAYEPGEGCPPDALNRGLLRDPESPSRQPLPCGAKRHPGEPDGYIAWHAWAEEMGKTHRQRMCPSCRLFHIWEPREVPPPPDLPHRRTEPHVNVHRSAPRTGPPQGWVARFEFWLRRRGRLPRVQGVLARWDERTLGKP